MKNMNTAETEYYTEILKTVHNGERIYFSADNDEEYVLISRKELDQMEKAIAFNKLLTELTNIKEENDRNNSWVPEDEAYRFLGWDEE